MQSLNLVLMLAILYGIFFTAAFFGWLWRKEKKKTMNDTNLPPQLANDSSFNAEVPQFKICNKCYGFSLDVKDCIKCQATGQVEMTPEEIRERNEDMKENRYSNDL